MPMLLLTQGEIFAPEPTGVGDVLVGAGGILAMGPSLDVGALVVTRIDCTGMRIVPGLIDVHTHLSGGGGEGGAHTRVPGPGFSDLTRHGVTTAVGLLGTDTVTKSLPDLLASARGLEALGLTAYCYTGGYDVPPVTLTGSVRHDIVHLDRVIGCGEVALSDHRSSQPTYEEIIRLAADCHVAGMMTGKAGVLHLHLGDGPRGLGLVERALRETEIPARVFHPTHCNRNPELWKSSLSFGRMGGYVDITAFPPDDDDPAISASEALWQWAAEGLPWGHVTLTSDSGGCLPTFDASGVLERMDVGHAGGLLDTVRALVSRGMPLGQALAPCTSSAADLYRFRKKGRVAVGQDADIAVLDDSLTLQHLICGGAHVVEQGRPLVRGPFEPEESHALP